MKKSVLSLLLAFFCIMGLAQNDNDEQLTVATPQPKSHCQPQGHNFTANGDISLMVVNPGNERFWLYVNGQLYTRQSTYVAKANLNPNFIYSIKVVMDNRTRDKISANVCLGGNGSNIILTLGRSQGHGFFSGSYYYMLWNGQKVHPGPGNYAYIWTDRSNLYNTVRIAGGMDFYPINPMGQPTPQPNMQPTPPMGQPCFSADFMRIKNYVKEQKFDNDRVNVALQAIHGRMVTAEQIAELAELITFESSRLEFLKSAYKDCFDKQNYYLTYRTLNFSSSKDELSKFIQRQ